MTTPLKCFDPEMEDEMKLSEHDVQRLLDDPVEHPSHYTHGIFEVIDVIEDWGFDKCYYRGNIIKYIARSQYKGNELEDLKKAASYLDRLVNCLEKKTIP